MLKETDGKKKWKGSMRAPSYWDHKDIHPEAALHSFQMCKCGLRKEVDMGGMQP